MKQFQIILGFILLASVTTFAQSPRIKLNQITKDTVKGSVLISNPSDSGMVYSRDFYIAYGADTLLILYGDTIGGVGGGVNSIVVDPITLNGNGTTASPLSVDTATVISTIQGFLDTLTNRNYLTTNETITLSGDVTGSGSTAITATVVDDSHNHIISNVDFLQDSLDAKANDSDLANYVTLSGADTITGAKTFTNTYTQSGGDANFDSGTLYVDESENRVGIGTSSPSSLLHTRFVNNTAGERPIAKDVLTVEAQYNGGDGQPYTGFGGQIAFVNETYQGSSSHKGATIGGIINDLSFTNNGTSLVFSTALTNTSSPLERMRIHYNGKVGIGTASPGEKLDVNGKVKIQDLTGTGGNAVYENGGVLGVASDARFKSHIADLDNGIEKILNLKPKYFIDNRNSSFQQLGFYAQEVKSVINEASYPIGNTEYLGINDRAIIAVTVKAIQEQQAIIETQEQKITDMEATIQSLITRIENLENK